MVMIGDEAKDILNINEDGSINIGNLFSKGFIDEVQLGNVPGHSIVSKFGAGTLNGTMRPVTQSQTYQTPTAAVALEFVSDDANDTALGTGATEITVTGLDSNWNVVTIIKATAGLTPVALGTDLLRLKTWKVTASGGYATDTAGSHIGNLTIRVAGVGATWSTIPKASFAMGRSQIGCDTIPINHKAYLIGGTLFVDTTKTADIYFFERDNADDVIAPYSGVMNLIARFVGVQGGYPLPVRVMRGPFVGPCDIGFMGTVSVGDAECSVSFEYLLIEDGY